ncbi:MAG: hypothetical protein RQ936_09110 [Gammaproteobacteria bacterium]|nr:hypothetical protein [Gammaproteobacteria bacterium]
MKIFLLLFALLAAVLLVFSFPEKTDDASPLTGLPWQIEIMPDGSTQVFGLHLGTSRLSDALDILGHDMELAIVAGTGEVGDLEMYYGNYRAGLLSGKLILQTSSSEENIQRWREQAIKSEYMSSGQAVKYLPSPDDLPQVLAETISGITFIPSLNLDEAIIQARFGEPEQRIQREGVTHWLYPEKGLDIAVFEEAKEVMQYVLPQDFQVQK